ncbi:hypothetical protein HELRODRAFT_114122 [Helobdella robusta]|uniref:K Homology domain-containing protein n=1 Tax=Helobdella robusta TaxID=6412 RepID=T1EFZ2_HELRO|nr:hypothetical protein HELRODRAFT_114122 [Helobdella robusta]ESN97716.1 hypothetical protein HELRODRAFT_114122 [Helobdella robusta]
MPCFFTVIGKGGEQITSIQNECQCKVQFAPDAGGPQRQCMLSGPAVGVMKAKKIIDDVILKNQLISLGGDEVALEIMIPGNKVGLIIGKNGDTIKQLQERSGVKVAVIQDSTQPSDYEKPLRISGNKLGCQKAREMVMELLNEHDKQNAGNTRPGGMGGAMGGGAGGYHGGAGGSKHNIEIPVPRGLVGIVIGKGGEMIKKIQEESGAKVQFRPDDIDDNGPNRICHVYGHKQSNDIAVNLIHDLIKTGMNRQNGGGMGGGGGGVPFATPFGNAPFPNGMIHPIPTDKCGLVIGKGGENIKEINRISGAHAELVRDQNNANADPNTKRFRIQGTPEQVQHCIQLINEKAGLVTGPPMVGGPVFGGLQGGPPMMSPYAPLNMQGPPGALVAPFPAQAQVLVPNQPMYNAPVPQAQYVSAAPAQPAGATYAQQPTPLAPAGAAGAVPYGQQQPQQPPQQQQQPAAVYVDPTKGADPNAAAWAAYYAQLYGGQQPASIQPAAGQQATVPQVQAIQAAPAVQGGHTQVAYATTQVLAAAAPVPAAAQPQPNQPPNWTARLQPGLGRVLQSTRSAPSGSCCHASCWYATRAVTTMSLIRFLLAC